MGCSTPARRLLQPRVKQRRSRGDASLGVTLHQLHQVAAILAESRPWVALEVDGVLEDGAKHLLGVGSLIDAVDKGKATGEELIRHNAAAPHVRLLSVVAVDHLGGHVRRRAAATCQSFAGSDEPGEAEVRGFQRGTDLVALEEEVVGFDVSEDDAAAVALRGGAKHRTHELGGVRLGVRISATDSAEQLPARAQVHQQVHRVVILEGVVQVNDAQAGADLSHHVELVAELTVVVLHARA